ncbi:hypothetical protein CMUS01_08153 [Colletotrichum musicola]|uniref:Uncharacterized protein n=1 Tax=Colletotrichum musicola TaxID=2175873 RepID=A0A8H6NE06_9PEZI|nr:hypothetical protein CMUS01_08153 [Colletotrichum musicola]
MSSFSSRAEPFFEVAAGVPYEADKNCTIDISGTMDSPYARREYLLGDDFTSFWFGGYEFNYTNSTTAYWNVWMQDAQYDSKTKAGDKPYKANMCSRNFTYNQWHDEWAWEVISWDYCNRTRLRCNGRIPDDTPGGNYIAVAIRDEVGTTSASSASSDEFTVVQSYNPTITPTMKPTSIEPDPGPGVATSPSTGKSPATAAGGGGVSAGVVAGASVGGVVALAGLITVLWILWNRRRHRGGSSGDGAGDGDDDETGRPELDGQAVVAAKTCVELDGKPSAMAELESGHQWTQGDAAELKGNGVTVDQAIELGRPPTSDGRGGGLERTELEGNQSRTAG